MTQLPLHYNASAAYFKYTHQLFSYPHSSTNKAQSITYM